MPISGSNPGRADCPFVCSARTLRLRTELLVYPGLIIKPTDWFFHGLDKDGNPVHADMPKRARALLEQNAKMRGGDAFGAPPSFVCAASDDTDCPCPMHTDPYVAALRAKSIEVTYVRRNFGGHGFCLGGGWTGAALEYLREKGFAVRHHGEHVIEPLGDIALACLERRVQPPLPAQPSSSSSAA